MLAYSLLMINPFPAPSWEPSERYRPPAHPWVRRGRPRRTIIGTLRQAHSSLGSQFRKYGGRPSWMAPLPKKVKT